VEGQTTAAQRVTDLKAQLAEAEAAAAPGPMTDKPAEGDGTRPQDGQPTATAEGTGAIAAAPASAAGEPAGAAALPTGAEVPAEKPPAVLDLLKQAHDEAINAGEGAQPGQHHFIETLRTVAERLVADGRIVEADLLTPAESGKVHAALIKVVGELLGKIHL
jgi:hypothetical protein